MVELVVATHLSWPWTVLHHGHEAQARLVHDRLKALGRAPGLVIYPDEGHGFTRRKNLTDYYERTVEFFRKELH